MHRHVIPEGKIQFCEKLKGLLRKYSKIVIVTAMNVNATQLLKIRHELTGIAEVCFGKNSLMRRAVEDLKAELPHIAPLKDLLFNGVGLCFTNGSFSLVKEIIDKHCVGSLAKVGAIAPCNVTILPMRTTLAPTQVSVLHALNIQSKIFKGSIEITSEKLLIKEGEKVGASEANLLQLLNILPFKYTLKVEKLFDSGKIYEPTILSINDEVLGGVFAQALTRVAGLSIGIGYPCAASAHHLVGSAFKDIAAIAVAIEFPMKEIADIQSILADPEALAAAQKATAQAAPAKGGETKVVKKEEEAAPAAPLDLGDMFGDW